MDDDLVKQQNIPIVECVDLLSLHPVLRRVISPSGVIYASDSFLFKDAFFGRDALEVAEDILEVHPQIAYNVILALAALQGVMENNKSEEEPGKIHHEYRSLYVNGRKIAASSQAILQELSQRWGGSDMEVLYYGTVDATPLYVRLIAEYCRRYGCALLDETYISRSGQVCTIRESVLSAVEWIMKKITGSDLHLLEFLRMSEEGHPFQDWKDGNNYAHLHINGEMLNIEAPIASIAVQGLAYDALVEAAQLLQKEFLEQALKWIESAERLQEATLRHFWIPEEQFFATALDRDSAGHPRQVQTITSDPGTLLATGLFDTLPEVKKQAYVTAIVQRIYSSECMTVAGVRCRSLMHKDLVPFADSQGAWAVWPKETYDIAKGLRRQGFSLLAEQLEVRILNVVTAAGSYAEFFYVHPDGHICYNLQIEHAQGDSETIYCTGSPEETQAWTISAVVAIEHTRSKPSQPVETPDASWQKRWEEVFLTRVPFVPLLKMPEEILSVISANRVWMFLTV